MGRHPNNKVWEYFDYVSEKIAKCRSCRAKISTPGSSRGNMVRHLFQLHGINTYTAGPKVGLVLNHIPSKRGREFDESLKEGEHTTFQRCKHELSIESTSQDIQDKEAPQYHQDDDGCHDLMDNEDNESINYSQSHHSHDEVQTSPKTPIIKVRSESNLRITSHEHKNIQNDHQDANDHHEENEAENIGISDPLLDLNIESLDPHLQRHTSNSMLHLDKLGNLGRPESPPPENSFTTDHSLERLKAEASAEKLLAEARYFNELADLTRSKRIYVDLQCQKLRNQLKKS